MLRSWVTLATVVLVVAAGCKKETAAVVKDAASDQSAVQDTGATVPGKATNGPDAGGGPTILFELCKDDTCSTQDSMMLDLKTAKALADAATGTPTSTEVDTSLQATDTGTDTGFALDTLNRDASIGAAVIASVGARLDLSAIVAGGRIGAKFTGQASVVVEIRLARTVPTATLAAAADYARETAVQAGDTMSVRVGVNGQGQLMIEGEATAGSLAVGPAVTVTGGAGVQLSMGFGVGYSHTFTAAEVPAGGKPIVDLLAAESGELTNAAVSAAEAWFNSNRAALVAGVASLRAAAEAARNVVPPAPTVAGQYNSPCGTMAGGYREAAPIGPGSGRWIELYGSPANPRVVCGQRDGAQLYCCITNAIIGSTTQMYCKPWNQCSDNYPWLTGDGASTWSGIR